MKKSPRTNGTGEILSLFLEMGRIIRKACLKDDAAALSLSALEALQFIELEDSPTMRDIAAHLRVAAPSATALVEHLVYEGFLIRSGDPKDRRVVRLSLSGKGKRVLRETTRRRVGVLRTIVGALKPGERKELARILFIIVKNAQSHGRK